MGAVVMLIDYSSLADHVAFQRQPGFEGLVHFGCASQLLDNVSIEHEAFSR